MKTKLTRQFAVLIALLGVLCFMAGSAYAVVNKTTVISPYWQSDSGSYTFIAVSHTSLSGMASQIGLTINALSSNNGDTSSEVFGTALTFTITSGETQRVFITRTNHATINPTAIPTAKFISGTTNYAHGAVRIDKLVDSYPNLHTSQLADPGANGAGFSKSGEGWRDHTMLSYWGSVVVEKNTTGFAMEFIGDMNDSQGGAINFSPYVSGVAAP
jgi:hypothetical protein